MSFLVYYAVYYLHKSLTANIIECPNSNIYEYNIGVKRLNEYNLTFKKLLGPHTIKPFKDIILKCIR